MRMRLLTLWPLLMTAGCGNLAYVHEETVGIDLSLSSNGTEHLLFGYEGNTVASVPRFQPAARAPDANGVTKQPAEEAMTLVSFGHTEAQGLDDILFYHIIATGEAARSAAKDSDQLDQMHKAVFGDNSK